MLYRPRTPQQSALVCLLPAAVDAQLSKGATFRDQQPETSQSVVQKATQPLSSAQKGGCSSLSPLLPNQVTFHLQVRRLPSVDSSSSLCLLCHPSDDLLVLSYLARIAHVLFQQLCLWTNLRRPKS